MHPSLQRNPFFIHMVQVFLNMAEHTSVTRKGKHHGLDLPEDQVLVLDSDPPLV